METSPLTCSTGQSLGLELLPPEIITSILDLLVPNPPEIGETRPVSYDKLVPGETWFDFTRNRRGLWSLCLVSRHLSAMAKPLLYRVMAILDEESMVLFFRTLAETPAIGTWSRSLSCHLTLTREGVIREMRRVVGKLLRTFKPANEPLCLMNPARKALEVMVLAIPLLSTSAGDFDEVPQVILFFILTFLTKLETLFLQVPISDEHHEYAALFIKLEATKRHFARNPDPEFVSFQSIKTLLLQGDPELLEHFENEDCDCEIPELYGAQGRRYWPMFNCFPNLTTLEVSTDDGVWSNALDQRDSFLSGNDNSLPYLKNIRHIYLHNSIACPRNLYQILRNAPQLETLYMTPRHEDAFYRGPGEDSDHAHPEALDVALASHAKHLRHLDVAWHDVDGFESLIGAEGRLTSLPEMGQLEKLCIQLSVLYGTSPTALETPLADLLPPNLVELTLEDWWWHNLDAYEEMHDWNRNEKIQHYHSQRHYRKNAIRMLMQLARDCKEKLPRLKNVLLLCKIPWTWMMEGSDVPLQFHFEEVCAMFGHEGVEFLVEDT